MSEKEEVFDLPEHIVVRILSRLPVKSLIRFSCVSKRWHSIIMFDTQFAKSHLQLASEQRTLRHRVLVSTVSIIDNWMDNDTYRYNPTLIGNSQLQCLEDLSTDKFRVTNCTFPSEQQSTIVMASCNGLVILGNYYENLSIWNPSTGFFRKIPDIEFSSITKGSFKDAYGKYGFGYVSATDDYKLVIVIPVNYSDVPVYVDVDVHIFIFSVRANSWSSHKAFHWSFSSLDYWRRKECGVLSNEAIHWISCSKYVVDGSLIEACCIYAFDLASEELQQMPVPVCDHDDEENYHYDGKQMETVVHLGGSLCLLSRYSNFFEENYATILWMMRDYGLSDSWIKIFEFSEDDLPLISGLPASHINLKHGFITENDAIVIKPFNKELVKIECRKGEKPVCGTVYMLEDSGAGPFELDTIVFDETLVSVPQRI